MSDRKAFRKKSGRGYSKRRVNTKEPKPSILIVCEGEKSEPSYFRGFKVSSAKVKVIGRGRDPINIVKYAIKKKEAKDYDQIWCVFDHDGRPASNITTAFDEAEKFGIQVAFSNECFEVWYLLHFDFHNTALRRTECYKKLSKILEREYEKGCKTMYMDLLHRQPVAIENAKRLRAQYSSQNPVNNNPYTTVYLLVEELNRFVPGQ